MKYTPLFRVHREAGALLEPLTHGWAVPLRFGDVQEEARRTRESAGLADWSWTSKIDLKGQGLQDATVGPGFRLWPLGGPHALAICEPQDRPALETWIASRRLYATDVTGGYAHFLLAGPRARGVLCKLTSLNLDAGGQASVAHTHGVVVPEVLNGVHVYHILVGREYGESVWHSVLHAGEEFQLRPVGVEAVRTLG